jgi:aminoglycoside/choline kinase family phosphotransferase
MAQDHKRLLDHIRALLHRRFPQGWSDVQLIPLQGDASDRRYYRLLFPAATEGTASLVVMRLARPYTAGELPFVNVQRYLALKGVPVPDIVYDDAAHGLILLEDLGDVTLEAALRGATEGQIDQWYRQALDLLLRLQGPGAPVSQGSCVAFRLAFDVEKLMWELDFFTTHMLQGLCGRLLPASHAAELRGQFWKICSILARQPRVLTHRDYHSRNLMLQGERLRVIDFQDARLGPCQYDVASLLNDSYVMLPSWVRDSLLTYYFERKSAMEGHALDRETFLRLFDYMSLQRNLKALGTFAFQIVVKGNPRYRSAIPTTLQHLQRTLSRRPELQPLTDLLEEHLLVAVPVALRGGERHSLDRSPARSGKNLGTTESALADDRPS